MGPVLSQSTPALSHFKYAKRSLNISTPACRQSRNTCDLPGSSLSTITQPPVWENISAQLRNEYRAIYIGHRVVSYKDRFSRILLRNQKDSGPTRGVSVIKHRAVMCWTKPQTDRKLKLIIHLEDAKGILGINASRCRCHSDGRTREQSRETAGQNARFSEV